MVRLTDETKGISSIEFPSLDPDRLSLVRVYDETTGNNYSFEGGTLSILSSSYSITKVRLSGADSVSILALTDMVVEVYENATLVYRDKLIVNLPSDRMSGEFTTVASGTNKFETI